jgi:hypothetical protein
MNNNKKINIKRFATFIVTFVLLTTTISVVAIAENNNSNKIINKYSFDTPITKEISIGNDKYDRVYLDNLPCFGELGEFNLPKKSAYLLINQGEEIINIDVITGKKIFLGSGYNIEPVQIPTPISGIKSQIDYENIEDEKHASNIYPDVIYDNLGTYWLRGYQILVLLLHPVQYDLESKSLYYFKDMTVKITTKDNSQINPMFRMLEKDEIEIIKKVDNPSVLKSYKKTNKQPLSVGSYDLLILTTERFKDAFIPLKDAHEANGLTTKIKTLNDISFIPSLLDPDDIRDYIRKEYRKNGIEYVLIGGDDDIVPAQKLWVQSVPHGDTTNMPSDLFYSCLDGTYNFDNDEYWGEPSDGDEGQKVDLFGEVYVGRACIDIISDAYNFVDKTIDYIESGGYSSGKNLMVGEYLWENPDTWGGDYMDEIVDGANTNGYTTIGIPSDIYETDYLYDRDWSGNSWPKSAIKSKINQGALIINHLGHSSYGYNMKMVNDDIFSLDNEDPFFVYSQGCMAGGFDDPKDYDCIAEYFTVKTHRAAFAVIMNARYGWGVRGSTNGPSQRFHREFWDAIFGEEIYEIGKANQDSKEDILPYLNYPCIRWCYYQLNLFGDPALIFYSNGNNEPNKPDKPIGTKNSDTEVEFDFSSTSTDPDGDMLYYKWDWGDGTFSDWLGPYDSGEQIFISHQWSEKGIYNVKVKARDEHRAESEWSDSLPIRMSSSHNFQILGIFFKILEKYFPNISIILNNILD